MRRLLEEEEFEAVRHYLWKIIDRAATKSTPRDWHGHVALLSISSGTTELASVVVTDEVATVWCENIHSRQQVISNCPLGNADSKIRLAVTPLHWEGNDHLQFWVVDRDDPARMVEVQMRRTSLLDLIYTTLASGAKSLEEFEAAILPEPDEEQRDLLRKFTEHLIDLGVLQVSSLPRDHLESWRLLGPRTAAGYRACLTGGGASSASEPSVPDNLKRDGFLDVYRRTITSAAPIFLHPPPATP